MTAPMACRSCRVRGLSICAPLSDRELAAMSAGRGGISEVPAGTDFVRQGDPAAEAFTVLDGWAMRYILLPDGGRQIVDFCLPGDFVGFQAGDGEVHDYSVQAITAVRVCSFARAPLLEGLAGHAEFAFRLACLSHRDQVAAFRHLTSVGRRSARGRIASLLLELFLRVRAQDDRAWVALPLTQEHIGDALGLTPVHVNRTLRRLREDGVVTLRDHRLTVHDLERLAGEAGQPMPPPRPA